MQPSECSLVLFFFFSLFIVFFLVIPKLEGSIQSGDCFALFTLLICLTLFQFTTFELFRFTLLGHNEHAYN